MAKATTWILWPKADGSGTEKRDLWFGMAAAKKLEALTGKSLLSFDETTMTDLGVDFLGKLIRAGMAHLSASAQPTEAEVDAALDALDREIEPAEPSEFVGENAEAEAAADVIARRGLGQEPKVERVPAADGKGEVFRVVDVPTQPAETFTTLTKRVTEAFAEGMPGTKKKRARPT